MAKKIAVISGKGGVGKTSVCCALASAVSKRGKNVLVVDCDKLCGDDLLLALGENVVYNWGDVVLGRCVLNEALYKAQNGVTLLPCPKSYEGITVQRFSLLAKALDKMFDYIFFDAPAGTELGFILAASVADDAIVVTLPDAISVRAAAQTKLEAEKYIHGSIRLIINRMARSEIIKRRFLVFDEIIDSVCAQLLGIVPEDRHLRLASQNGLEENEKRAYAKAVNAIAARLDGEDVPLKF